MAMTRKIDAMHAYYGTTGGMRCENCEHLVRNVYNRSYYKCLAYGDSRSEATDWAKSWRACGLWNEPLAVGHVPLIKRLRPTKNDAVPVEGQICLFEGVSE